MGINHVEILRSLVVLFVYFIFWLRVQDLSSLTRDPAQFPCIGRANLNPWTPGKSLTCVF